MGLNVLVTGGAGYVGSATSALLLQQGHQVTVIDNLSRGHRQAVPPEARLIVGDLGDARCLDQLFSEGRFDAVMHFAALIEAGESMQKPEIYFRNNVANTLTLLETVLKHKVSRFIFSSTAALYGNPEETPIAETAPLRPTNAYGASKLIVEQMLDWFHRLHGLRYASLRYFNAAGARPGHGEAHHPESHLIPRILQVALGHQPSIAVFGTDYATPDGTCIRDYVHVSDLAAAHLLVLQNLPSNGQQIYNLGNGLGFSVLEVIAAARQVTGHPIPVELAPRRPGDPAILVASSENIRRELGWQPRFAKLSEIIRTAWEWHSSHPAGYQNDAFTARPGRSVE